MKTQSSIKRLIKIRRQFKNQLKNLDLISHKKISKIPTISKCTNCTLKNNFETLIILFAVL